MRARFTGFKAGGYRRGITGLAQRGLGSTSRFSVPASKARTSGS